MMQRYKLTLIRQESGKWDVAGYWEDPLKNDGRDYKRINWNLDGAIKTFDTRKEALEFCLSVTGVPD